jgi:Protein of unknown function (DUF3298)
MKLRKLTILLLLLPALSVANSCKKKAPIANAPVATGAPATTSPDQYHQTAGGVLSPPQARFFKGSIGTRLGLEMKLTRTGDQVAGSYSYQKVGARIDLKGTVDKDNNVTLEEYDSGGKQTGLFKGVWITDLEDGLASIAGNWSKPNGEKKTAFSLHEEPIELTGGVELTAHQVKETNKKLGIEIDAQYPQAVGALGNQFDKFNQEAKGIVTRQVAEFKKGMTEAAKDQAAEPAATPEDKSAAQGGSLDIGYSVALAKDDLISIAFDLGSYSAGAAHPSSSSLVLNYDVKGGRTLKLSDLFNPGAKYLQTISSYCIKDLKKQAKSKSGLLDDATIESGAGADAKNYQSWTITKKGLAITFDPYQVGPYAAGPQSVVVPYSALKELVKTDGPLASFVK